MDSVEKTCKLVVSNEIRDKQIRKKPVRRFHNRRSKLMGSSSSVTGDSGRPRENMSGPILTRTLMGDSLHLSELHMSVDCALTTGHTTERRALTAPMSAVSSSFNTPAKPKFSVVQPRQGSGETVLQKIELPSVEYLLGVLEEQLQGCSIGSVKPRTSIPIPVVHNFRGINFYKRTGLWAANIWAEGNPTLYRAYDKARIKHLGTDAELNFERDDYLEDIEEMAELDNNEYMGLLIERTKSSSRAKVEAGIILCPEGWFEVRVRDRVPPRDWQSLGKYASLEDASAMRRN